ncbi:TonB-dependent receptor [Thiobaca trueperi]|uniref:Iron complex outermembrane receptor protein n=1 Tax=Thiobaca trueperi TaxID=127458 RepID=A0A4R3MYF7_9GAMM|nr:TonB-dependent receptor [Thiobaca trueperi]TCT21424.1 iron complex outermembrane receptor protein [Thiobaca trueperi]
MQRHTPLLMLLYPALAIGQTALAASDAELPTVEVRASPVPSVAPLSGQDYSASRVTADGIATFGGPAQTNPYRALDLMPSVNLSGTDAYGLSVDQNFMRIRGVSAYSYSNLAVTVNGTPSSVSAGRGGVGNLFDLENLDGLTLWRGPQPANVGFGMGNLAGSLDLNIKAPTEDPGLRVRTAIGGDHFHKVFARIDTGTFNGGSRLFLSGSTAETDKWRGPGDQSRDTVNAGFNQTLGEHGNLEVYAAHNHFRRDEYRPLTYAQSQDLGTYRDFDFNAELTGIAADDVNYYAYNTQHFDENNVLARLAWDLSEDLQLRFNPYWLSNEGQRSTGKSNTVTVVDIDQEQYGATAELVARLAASQTLTLGYWSQRISTMPPPLSQKVYALDKRGRLVFSKWGILADMGDRAYESPYLQLAGESGRWRYSLGLRYLSFRIPGITSYDGTGLPDVSHDAALALDPAVNARLSTQAVTLDEWLPTLTSRWILTPSLDARTTYGRTVGNPWMGPLYSVYMSNQKAFQKAGIPLQTLWDELQLETSDTVEIGLEWHQGPLSLSPTLFYSRLRDKQVTAYDPLVGVSYLQSGVEATAYGAELEASWGLTRDWILLGGLSWNLNQLDDDIRTASQSVLATSGNQVPDAPEWMVKLGAEYRAGNWSLTPLVRYVGARFGDALNEEEVDAYTTVDLTATYRIGSVAGIQSLEVGLSLLNLFDARYIGTIDVGQDDARPGSIDYYPGAPRTLALSVSANF